uniref:Ig-like domain-containing protein n=1 Tax=Scleropages formosus TaxID=113540 RepID=A0A8C9SN67_SCLFO
FVLSLLQKSLCVYRFEVLGPAQPVVAVAGEDVVLPCYIKPNISAVDLSIEWFRVHSEDPLVHLYRDHEDRNEKQIPSYSERTSLFPEELRNGNTSLKVKNVRGSDNGQYKCLVQSAEWYDDSYINVHIKAIGTQPMISIEGYKEGGISLVCESKGWYPQPQVVWMDSEGHKLPAGHTETYTDSMGLFIVRRRVIVQETKTNSGFGRVLLSGGSEISVLLGVPCDGLATHPGCVLSPSSLMPCVAGLGSCLVTLCVFMPTGVTAEFHNVPVCSSS